MQLTDRWSGLMHNEAPAFTTRQLLHMHSLLNQAQLHMICPCITCASIVSQPTANSQAVERYHVSPCTDQAPAASALTAECVCWQALTSIPVQFLRIVGILLFWVLTLLSGTERAKARRWSNQYIKFGPDVRHALPHLSSRTCHAHGCHLGGQLLNCSGNPSRCCTPGFVLVLTTLIHWNLSVCITRHVAGSFSCVVRQANVLSIATYSCCCRCPTIR